MILVYLGRWSYGRFQDDNNIFYKIKNDLTTQTWQDNIWCPIIIILFCTSDVILPSDCNARIHTLRVDCKQAVSLSQLAVILSQPLCTYHNKTWGHIKHFFKSCLAIVTIGFCSVSLTRMHWHPVPQKIKQSYTKNCNALVYNINKARQSFFQWGFVPNCLMTACLIATDDVYIHHQCHQSIFPLNSFYASIIITC